MHAIHPDRRVLLAAAVASFLALVAEPAQPKPIAIGSGTQRELAATA